MIPFGLGFFKKKIDTFKCWTLFDGINESITISDGVELSFERTDAFSFSFWTYKSNTSADGVIAKQSSSSLRRGYYVSLDNSVNVNFRSSAASWFLVKSPTNSVVINEWQHIVIAYDGSSNAAGCKIYINSILQTPSILANTLSSTMVDLTVKARIGRRELGNYYKGSIDEVAIWGKELTSSEVLEIYNLGRKNSGYMGFGIISHWKMDTINPVDEISGFDGTSVNMDSSNIICE